MGQEEPKSWGKGLVFITILIALVIVFLFFSRLALSAKHSYQAQYKAKTIATEKQQKKQPQVKVKPIVKKQAGAKSATKKEQAKAEVMGENKNLLSKEEAKKADALMKGSDCIVCHNPALVTVIAPQFADIAKRYKNANAQLIKQLADKVRKGGNGNWQPKYVGVMTPHPNFTDEQLELMVKRVLDTK